MIEQQLEQQLEQFLKENNRQYYEGSIKYKALRKSGTPEGIIRNLHIVSYMVSISDQPYDGDGFYYAHFDETKHHLVYILGPQSTERIGE
ncbi:hypothetical protein [Pontimicrobium sp. MEBiC06410]